MVDNKDKSFKIDGVEYPITSTQMVGDMLARGELTFPECHSGQEGIDAIKLYYACNLEKAIKRLNDLSDFFPRLVRTSLRLTTLVKRAAAKNSKQH